MKHKTEIDKILRDLFYEDWMTEEEFNESLDMMAKQTGMTAQKLSDDIEVGISNGYDVETQMGLVKVLIKGLKSQ